MDQAALADKAGVSQQAISKIERGASLEPKTLPRLCKVLGVSVEEVLAEAGAGESRGPRARTAPGARASTGARAPRSRWPFMLPYQRFERLTHAQKLHVESVLIEAIARFELAAAQPNARATAAARAAKPRH